MAGAIMEACWSTGPVRKQLTTTTERERAVKNTVAVWVLIYLAELIKSKQSDKVDWAPNSGYFDTVYHLVFSSGIYSKNSEFLDKQFAKSFVSWLTSRQTNQTY